MTPVTDISQLNPAEAYTYADYLLWKFRERVELIKGKIFKMSPAPSRKHQEISWVLARYVDKAFSNFSCKMYTAPFDVRLTKSDSNVSDEEIHTVVQPDLCIICDLDKLDDKGCIGAPDLIIEILSPGNSQKEMGVKFTLYEENGVREYWMVDTVEKSIFIYVLKNGKYVGLKPFIESELVKSEIFPQLEIPVDNIFKD